jgi:hypothetical protein
MGWQEDVLRALHHVWHVSLSLQPVDNEFDLTSDYLQSLMMVVALVLALGFSILVLLALFLCLVISFAQPVLWPSWGYRLFVSAAAVTLMVVASKSVSGSLEIRGGITKLEDSIDQLRLLLSNVRAQTSHSTWAHRLLASTPVFPTHPPF